MSSLVSIFGTKLINLLGTTSVSDTDYVIIQKNTNGDQKTYKMLWSTIKALIELSDSEKIVEVNADYIADGTEDAIFCTGTITVTLIDSAVAIKSTLVGSLSGTVTIASVSPVSDTSITTGISRRYYPITSGWESA